MQWKNQTKERNQAGECDKAGMNNYLRFNLKTYMGEIYKNLAFLFKHQLLVKDIRERKELRTMDDLPA